MNAQHVAVQPSSGVGTPAVVRLEGAQDLSQMVRPGWLKVEPSQSFPTFTTSRPQARPGRKPTGIQNCTPEELQRWVADMHRFPPYQYQLQHCLVNRQNHLRIPDVSKREMMMGFPLRYTASCLPKGQPKSANFTDARLTLLGNSWSVPVVAWLIGQLLGRLGLIPTPTPQQVLDNLVPGTSTTIQGRLVRLPLNPARGESPGSSHALAMKLGNLISLKGEDIMLNAPSSQMIRYRAVVPVAMASCHRMEADERKGAHKRFGVAGYI